ncbi:uncharacterized protein EV422DRAFT_337870 [Fimicolochytrium jonesii]|uniref:uncharacterized protein n=1 Tax=Fimicolochytrium jonesii TaxID=1396493 RepID=UPI0022FF1CEE|nr:uncharacterized protein EV422DRAFT_337870 [Fimicolochytrium jonesii]KAI8815973.1 hypothetical protein EV422DRAFT_337870 [Fimicolochytrium jonesii]
MTTALRTPTNPLPPIGSGSHFPHPHTPRLAAASSALAPDALDNSNHSTPPTNNSTRTTTLSSKLTNVEAQRILSVVVETQRKVQLVGLLPDAMDRRMGTVFVGEIVGGLTELRQLEAAYTAKLVAARAAIQNGAHGAKDPDLHTLPHAIRSVTRTLVRHFLQHPTASSKLRYLKSTKTAGVSQFESLLQEVRNLVYERLATTVEDEAEKRERLSGILGKEMRTSNEVKLLREELDKAKKERTAEVNKRNEVIRRLKEELRTIKKQAEDTTKRLESRSKQKEDADVQAFKDKQSHLQTETAALRQHLATLTQQHNEEEANLRKRKFKVESEVENWIHKYDQDMDEKQTELEDITAIYLEEKAQLDELSARHADMKKEYETIMEERKVEDEKRKEREALLRRNVMAATRIQALFKGWKVRRELAKQRSGSAKKGKGGKGKAGAKSAKGGAKSPKKK